MTVPDDLMKIINCPKCKGSLKEEGMFLTCDSCKLAYPVLDGDVPDLLIEDSWPLDRAKRDKFKHELKL